MCLLLQGKDIVYRYATAGYRDCAKVFHATRLDQAPSGVAQLVELLVDTSPCGINSLTLGFAGRFSQAMAIPMNFLWHQRIESRGKTIGPFLQAASVVWVQIMLLTLSPPVRAVYSLHVNHLHCALQASAAGNSLL